MADAIESSCSTTKKNMKNILLAATKNIQADASDYASRNNRGVAYLEMGEIQAALEDFIAVCQLAPQESSPLLSLAGISEDQLNDLQGALADMRRKQYVLNLLIPPAILFGKAFIVEKLGDTIRAEEDHQSGNRCRVAEGYSAIE